MVLAPNTTTVGVVGIDQKFMSMLKLLHDDVDGAYENAVLPSHPRARRKNSMLNRNAPQDNG